MPTPPIADSLLLQAVEMVAKHKGNVTHAATELKMDRTTLQGRLRTAQIRGIFAGRALPDRPSPPVTAPPQRDVEIESLRRQLREAQSGETLQTWAKSIIEAANSGALERGPAPWLRERVPTPSPAGIPTLLLSDLHWGEVVRPGEIEGANEFNMPIARQRLRSVIEKSATLLRDHVVGDYPGIVMCLGGDLISGSIHDELEQTNEGTVMQQVLDIFEHLQTAIQFMADTFGRVHLPCVVGNHGRSNRKWQAARRGHLSYEWLLYKFLERAFAKDERVSFQIPDGPDASFDLLGTGYRLTHGDSFRGGDGIIGPIGPVTRGTLKRARMASALGSPFDVLLLGHFHCLTWGQRFIINGSLPGFSPFAMSMSIDAEPPAQALWLTTENHGRTIQLPVYP